MKELSYTGKICPMADGDNQNLRRKKKMTTKATRYAILMEECASYVREVKPNCNTSEKAVALLRPLMQQRQDMGQEAVWVIMLDTKMRAIGAPVEVSRGTLDECMMPTRDIMRAALMANASAVILAHNHPSGDPRPSAEDVNVTKKIMAAGDIIGVRVLDHIIIGTKTEINPGYTSIRAEGLVSFK